MRGKDFGRGVQVGIRVEESANVTRERPVFRLPGRIQRNRRLAVGIVYLLPARFAFADKGWKRAWPRATAIACSFLRRSEFVITRLTALGIGALMNVRGLMELIIISIGLQRGIFTPTLFAILVVMAIVTTPDGHAAVRMDAAQARDNETSSSGLRCLTSNAESSFALVPQLLQVFHARTRGFPKRACCSGDNAFDEAKHGHGRIPLRWNARLDRKGDLRETRDG